ncbi:MAG: hypothetical protein VKO65_02650 [Cyanobacteriota bacterium]|nr:hypothetical protein [Cyanobacteriota bacterium]
MTFSAHPFGWPLASWLGSTLKAIGISLLLAVPGSAAPRPAPPASQVRTADAESGLRPLLLRQGPLEALLQHERRLDADGLVTLQPIVVVRLDGREVGRLKGAVKVGSNQPMALLQLAELDPANPWPEVLLSSFSGGAHCCNDTRVLTSDAAGNAWHSVALGPFNGVVRAATDPLGLGRWVVVDADNRFLYEFSSYAGSRPPLRIWQLSGRRFEDVSHQAAFVPLHRRALGDMESWVEQPDGSEANGFLAGYVATKALVGEFDDGWRRMLGRYDRRSELGLRQCAAGLGSDGRCQGAEVEYATYPEALRAFLLHTGYIGRSDAPRP